MIFFQPMVNGEALPPKDGDPLNIIYETEYAAMQALTESGYDVSAMVRVGDIMFDSEKNICIAIIHV